MSAVGVLVGIFVAVAVGGGVVKCALEPNPENKSVPEKFMRHTLETGGKMITETGRWVNEKASDPETQEAVRSATKEGLEATEKTLKSVIQGTTQMLNESTERERQRKQQLSPNGP